MTEKKKQQRKSGLAALIEARRDKYKAWLTKAGVGQARPDSSQNYSANAKAEELRPVGKIVTV